MRMLPRFSLLNSAQMVSKMEYRTNKSHKVQLNRSIRTNEFRKIRYFR